jgi:hypothetical protein
MVQKNLLPIPQKPKNYYGQYSYQKKNALSYCNNGFSFVSGNLEKNQGYTCYPTRYSSGSYSPRSPRRLLDPARRIPGHYKVRDKGPEGMERELGEMKMPTEGEAPMLQ